MARQARKELRDEKKADWKEKRAEKKAKLSADWEGFKAKFKKDYRKKRNSIHAGLQHRCAYVPHLYDDCARWCSINRAKQETGRERDA